MNEVEPLIVALIVAIPTLCATTLVPVLLNILNNRNAAREKQMDYARQDRVAAQAAEAATLLLASNKRADETADKTIKKLDEIHVLVNSKLTASMEAELGATTRELLAISEIIELKKENGSKPSVESLAALQVARARIAELHNILAERRR